MVVDQLNALVPETSKEASTFIVFARKRFLLNCGSIYVNGIVGGIFMEYLLHDDEDCWNDGYINVFLIITVLHFICGVREHLSQNASLVFETDGKISRIEKVIQQNIFYLQQVFRLIEFIPILMLGYYVFDFHGWGGRQWTFEIPEADGTNSEDCTVCYCSRSDVHNAELCFYLHIVYAVATFIMWLSMWWAHKDLKKEDLLKLIEKRREAVATSQKSIVRQG